MKKKFLSVIAICSILSSVAAPYCSASNSELSSWVDSSTTSSSSILSSSIQSNITISSSDDKCALRKQNDQLQTDFIKLADTSLKLLSDNSNLRSDNSQIVQRNTELKDQIKKLQKRHPFMRLVKIAGVLYIVYDVYNKNSSEDNFDFVKTFAKESANQLKSNVSCEDAANKILCVVEQKAASLAGYVKGFTSAELCVLTNGSLCPETIKDNAHVYLLNDQSKTLSFIK